MLPKKKILIISVSSIIVLLAIGSVIWALNRTVIPDPQKQSDQQKVEYLASDDFAKLPNNKKKEYIDKAGDDVWKISREAPEEQRQKLRENVRPVMRSHFRQRMDERVDKYFELPEDERAQYLDDMIDDMQERMANRDPNRQRGSGQRRGRGFTPERMKNRLEKSSPEKRAKRVEFMKAFRDRMEERGIKSPWRR